MKNYYENGRLDQFLAFSKFCLVNTQSEFLCQTNHCHVASKVRTLEPSIPGISLFNCRLLVSLGMYGYSDDGNI